MDVEFENELRPELGREEKLVWTGKPKTGVIFYPSDLFLIPFSLVWAGIPAGAAILSTMKNGRNPGLLFFFPFFVIGFYLLIGRFWVDARRRRNTLYGVTDSRIIIKSGIFTRGVKSFNIKVLPDITIREKGDGRGTISFGQLNSGWLGYSNLNWPGYRSPTRLELIDNVREVYRLILQQQRS